VSGAQNQSASTRALVCVLGAGSWGTSLAVLLARNGAQVRLWARDEIVAQKLRDDGENARYLPGVPLQGIEVSSDLAASTRGAQFVILAVPGVALPQLSQDLVSLVAPEAILVSGTKGLHPESGLRASQIWSQYDIHAEARFVVLSGPNLAKEMVAGVPTSTVVASRSESAARAAQQLFASKQFRVYTNTDLIGVELGGALKNVVALAAGIGDGLGYGDNSKAALMTRAWREMTRLSVALGARESTLSGLSGLGDLIATCLSPHSRNRSLGERLGRGETLNFAQHEMAQVAEGVPTTRAALHLSRESGVSLPVTEQVAAVLFQEKSPQNAVAALMERQGCEEV
jgi:glycerol-3-phosphate dehydrogenase (NAD(P)+)